MLDLRLDGRLVTGIVRWSERAAKGGTATGYARTGEGKVSGTFNPSRLELQLRVAAPPPSGPSDLRLLVADERLGLRGSIVSVEKVSGTFRGEAVAASAR